MIVAPWGDEKTGKSSFALTFPKPIAHFDMDFGFSRVEDRFREEIDKGLIVSKAYPIPIQELMFSSQVGRPIKGVREVYEEFLKDYVEAVLDKDILTLVVDTHTQLWEIVRLGFLQEKQELQDEGEKARERLMPYEYGEPNDRMKRIIQAARMYDKHLVMVHYAKDEYKPMLDAKGAVEQQKTGKIIMDSFKHVPDLSDIVVQTSREKERDEEGNLVNKFYGEVVLCGLDVRLEGMNLIDPTYDMIVSALEGLKNG